MSEMQNVRSSYESLRAWTAPDLKDKEATRIHVEKFRKGFSQKKYAEATAVALIGFASIAKQMNFEEWKEFVNTGEIASPVKLTPDQLDSLKGGGIWKVLSECVSFIVNHWDHIEDVKVVYKDGTSSLL